MMSAVETSSTGQSVPMTPDGSRLQERNRKTYELVRGASKIEYSRFACRQDDEAGMSQVGTIKKGANC